MVTGPPSSRKTTYGKKIADHYRIPVISLPDIIANAPNIEENFIAEDFAEYKEEILAYIAEESAAPKKKLSEPVKLLFRLIKHRLSQNDCRNRGFILDAFPIHYNDAKFVFYEMKKKLKRKKRKKKKK